MVIFWRDPPQETWAIHHIVVGYSWESALLHAAREGLERLCNDYEQELMQTPYHFFSKMTKDGGIRTMLEGSKGFSLLTHIQNLGCYAYAAKEALDDTMAKYVESQRENDGLRQEYNNLRNLYMENSVPLGDLDRFPLSWTYPLHSLEKVPCLGGRRSKFR